MYDPKPVYGVIECPECGWPSSDLIPDPWDGSLCCPRCLTHIPDPVTYPPPSRTEPLRDDLHPEGF